jgi:hypothetical protein
MGIFGWSYPPGCSGPPDDPGPGRCDRCGKQVVRDPRLCAEDWVCHCTAAEIAAFNDAMAADAADAANEEPGNFIDF